MANRRPIFLLSVGLALLLYTVFYNSESAYSTERPFGYIKLGNLEDFKKASVFLSTLRLLVKHDKDGFSVMSTNCTYDGSALARIKVGERYVLKSEIGSSLFDESGKVIRGPATKDLPHYRLILDSSKPGTEPDLLYVEVGAVRSGDWRVAL